MKREHSRDPRRKMIESAKQRARRGGLPFALTIDDLPPAPWTCPYFGFELKTGGKRSDLSASLDRITPSLGYIPGNVEVISWKANRLKNNMSAKTLRRLAIRVHQLTEAQKAGTHA